jgi:hypothetical protein
MGAHFWGAGWVLATGRCMAEEGVHGAYSFCFFEWVPRTWRVRCPPSLLSILPLPKAGSLPNTFLDRQNMEHE